jgi:hypothetical protein
VPAATPIKCLQMVPPIIRRRSKICGVYRQLVKAADWVKHWESGMIRVAMTYRLGVPRSNPSARSS